MPSMSKWIWLLWDDLQRETNGGKCRVYAEKMNRLYPGESMGEIWPETQEKEKQCRWSNLPLGEQEMSVLNQGDTTSYRRPTAVINIQAVITVVLRKVITPKIPVI